MGEIEDRIKDKIEDIEKYLSELYSFFPKNFEEYKENVEIRAASERYFEKIIEAVTDIVFLVIRKKELGIPEDDESAFDFLSNNRIIRKELSSRLKDAKRMRNFIIHQYHKVEDIQVYTSISEELKNDVEEFIKSVRKVL